MSLTLAPEGVTALSCLQYGPAKAGIRWKFAVLQTSAASVRSAELSPDFIAQKRRFPEFNRDPSS